MSKSFNMIEKIIKDELVEIYLQPIVSIRTKKIYAFEALTRCTFENEIIDPDTLFKLANEQKLSFELDEMTRKKAIRDFYDYYQKDNDLILFLNVESTLINDMNFIKDDNSFVKVIEELKIPFINFVLEIKEDEIKNEKSLKLFVSFYKKLGFSIALDDFGTGSSTFDRINLIRPNIIKIDKSLFDDIENNQINKQIVKSISKMCHNIGIRVLAEGVEEQCSVLIALKSGINLFQGYYFSKPLNEMSLQVKENILEQIVNVGNNFRIKTIKTIKNKRETIQEYNIIALGLINKIIDIDLCMNIMKIEVIRNKEIEAIYLIDEETSKQIHNTAIIEKLNVHFKSSKHGDEHYLKEYYYVTRESINGIFLSHKYISYATGSICKTFAKKFNKNDKSYILCIDIVLEKR